MRNRFQFHLEKGTGIPCRSLFLWYTWPRLERDIYVTMPSTSVLGQRRCGKDAALQFTKERMSKTDRRIRSQNISRPTWRSSQPTAPNEEGAILKDWGGRLSVALTMPNTYYVGMSSLALQLLYRMFNAEPDVVCERIFWEKGAADGQANRCSRWRAGAPPTEFDIWAFTISWEMDYFNVVEMLRQAGMPPLAADRQTRTQWDGSPWPLLIAGGPGVTMNPEPMAPFFDAILIGEG